MFSSALGYTRVALGKAPALWQRCSSCRCQLFGPLTCRRISRFRKTCPNRATRLIAPSAAPKHSDALNVLLTCRSDVWRVAAGSAGTTRVGSHIGAHPDSPTTMGLRRIHAALSHTVRCRRPWPPLPTARSSISVTCPARAILVDHADYNVLTAPLPNSST
eukprot:355797-Chlamydomonas_euryale.AAC.14